MPECLPHGETKFSCELALNMWIFSERFRWLCFWIKAELNDVLEDDKEESPAPTPPAVTPPAPKVSVTSHSAPPATPSGATGLESRLLERIEMYKTAISNAKAAGETSKVRRYDRGLKVKLGQKGGGVVQSS